MSGWALAMVDLDNDGFKDIVTANSHANDRIEEFEQRPTGRNGVFRNVNGVEVSPPQARLPSRARIAASATSM
jgi:hypothetical protein